MIALFVLASVALVSAQKWQLFTDAASETRFRLRAGNNEPVLASEGYSAKSGAVAGIAACKAQAKDMTNFELKNSTNGKPYFVLKSGNGMVIGTSELYESLAGANSGITAVMTAAAAAETISDQTVTSTTGESGQFQVFLDAGGEYRYRLLAGNGEPILASEGYKSKSGCLNGIDSVRNNVGQLSSFVLKQSMGAKVQYYFNIVANNNEVIGVSELYTTSGARAIGQFSVIRIAPDAAVVDLTIGTVPPRVGRFEIFESIQGNFRFTLKAKNYQVILTSESYTTKAAAMNGIDSVKTNSPMAARYANLTAANGQVYFNLRAGNNFVIGTSETYTSESGRSNGIKSVMETAPMAEIIDRTTDNRFISKFEIFCDDAGSYFFRLRSPNGQSLIVSSAYATSADAQAAIGIVKALAPTDARYTKVDSPATFTISAAMMSAIAFSDSYSSTAARDAGIEAVKGSAPTAVVVSIPCVTKQATVATTTVVTKAGETTVPVTPPPEAQLTTATTFTIPEDPSKFTDPPQTTATTYAVFTIPINTMYTMITTTEAEMPEPDTTTTTTGKGSSSSASQLFFTTVLALLVVVVAIL